MAAALPSVPAAVGTAALFFWVFLLIDSTCGDGRAAVFAVVDVPVFNAPAAAPDEPDRVERSFVPSVATAACFAGSAGAAVLRAGTLVATVDLRAAVASAARDAVATFAAAFFATGALTGALVVVAGFFAVTGFFAGAAFFAGAVFFATGFATGFVVFATGLAGAFFAGATFFAGAAFLAAGFDADLAAFFTAGFVAVLRAGGAAFFAVFFVATSAFPLFP
jgi:hypothetical protein